MAKASKQTTPDVQKEKKKQTSFSLDADVMKSVNVISALEEISITEIVETALKEYINRWENKNGALPQKRS